jgi:hypothetical protein
VQAEEPQAPASRSNELPDVLAGLEPKTLLRADVSGKRFEGQLSRFEDSSLVLQVDVFDEQELAYDGISQLSVVGGNHRREGQTIGGRCGAVAGLLLGATAEGLSSEWSGVETSGTGVLIGTCVGTIAGIMIGGLVGNTLETWVPIWP